MEFLLGRLLRDALLNVGGTESSEAMFRHLGLSLSEVEEREHEAGLGNGGLGRLAGCFFDSSATLGLPVTGYGLRYQYGMFSQCIKDGVQVEEPDFWLRDPYPWEIARAELTQRIKFGGRVEVYQDHRGYQCRRWVGTNDVLAVPYDIPVPGYRNDVVNTLRLRSAQATDEFDLREVMTKRCEPKKQPKTSRWCFTRTTSAKTAKSYGCASSISWYPPAYKTQCVTGSCGKARSMTLPTNTAFS